MFKSKGSHAKRQSFSGEDIIVRDSRFGRIYDLKVYGKSYQADTPTTDNPVDILNVPSEIDFAVNNKNLFTTAKFGNVTTPQIPTHFITIAGVNAFSGSKNVAATVQSEGFLFDVLPSMQYTVSFHFSKEILIEGSNCTSYTVRVFDKTGGAAPDASSYFANSGYVDIASDETGDETFTFTTPTGCDMIGIVFSFYITPTEAPWNERVKMHLSNVQLELGSNATEFAPYYRITTPLTVKDKDNNLHKLCSVGDIRDEVNYTAGKIIKLVGEIVFDGDANEDWQMIVPPGGFVDYVIFYINLPSGAPDGNNPDNEECVCNQAIYDGTFGQQNHCIIVGNRFQIYVPEEVQGLEFNDVDVWRYHLSRNNLIVQYELIVPQVYDLHPDERSKFFTTFEGDNYITTEIDNGVKPDLEFRAISYEQGE
jgi:hypothetical protein